MALTRPTVAQLNTIITEISDPITLLNRGSTQANVDVGFVLNRDGGVSPNVAIYWNETADSLVTAYTTSTGGVYANIALTSYANLTTGNVTANGNITTVDGYFVGNGYFLTGIVSGGSSNYSNSNVASYLPTYSGNIANIRLGVSGVLTFADGTTQTTAGGGQADKILSGSSNVTVTSDYVNVAILSSNVLSVSSANVSITGNLLPSANVTYNLGSPTQRWNVGYFAGNTLDLGGAQISVNAATGIFTFTSNGVSTDLGGTSTLTVAAVNSTGFINTSGNVSAAVHTGGAVSVTGFINTSGNVSGAVVLGGTMTTTGTLTAAVVNSTGNVLATTGVFNNVIVNTGNINAVDGYFVGNGYFLTGIVSGGSNYGNINVQAYTESMGFTNYSNVNVAAYVTTNGLTNYSNVNVKAYTESMGFTNYSNVNVAAYVTTNELTNYSNINTAAYLASGLTSSVNTSGNVNIGGNLFVSGAVYIAGNTTTISTNNVVFNDSLIYLADGNPTDFLDIGFVGNFTRSGLYQHTGFVRDANDGVWKLFEGVEPEPTTVIDFGSASYSTALIGNLVTRSNVTIGGNTRLGGALLTSSGFGGDSGQYLTSTGTGIAWTSIDLSTLSDGGTTTVTAEPANVNVTVNASAIASFSETGLSVFGNARLGLAGAVSGQFHSVVGNITQTTSGGAVYITTAGTLESTASVSAANQISALRLTGAPSGTNSNIGLLQIGTPLTFNDTDIVGALTHNVNSYAQVILQNKNSGTAASADYIVNNDLVGGQAVYGDYGINSSGFTDNGTLFNTPTSVYLFSAGGNLNLGTQGANWLRIGTNNTTDVLMSPTGEVNVNVSTQSTSTTSGALTVLGGVGVGANVFIGGNLNVAAGRINSGGLTENQKARSVNFVLDGGGTVLTTGSKVYAWMPANATIIGWTVLADQSGTANIDIKKATYADFPTTTSIAGISWPGLSAAQKNQDLDLTTGWGNITVIAGEILEANVVSASTVTRVTVALEMLAT